MTDTHAGQDALAPALAEMIVGLNDHYEDSVVFVARILGGRPAATGARVTSVDRGGIDCVITDPTGEHPQRLAFARPAGDADALATELFTLVGRARELSGVAGTTSAERTVAEMRGIRTFLAEVTAVEQVHPHLRRISFGGSDLAGFAPVGPDSFLYVLLPPPGRTELTVDRSFSWEQVGAMPEDERPVGAYYTVRAWHPETATLDMLFVLHGDPCAGGARTNGDGNGNGSTDGDDGAGRGGAASSWAERARPGDPVALWGPRSSYNPPPGTDWYLLVADDTGLPAAAGILESLPTGTPARVVAEVTDETEHQDLPASPSIEVTWLHRHHRPAGTTSLLVDAVRQMDWPAGTPYVWGGGESRAMTAIRNHVRHDRGLPRAAVDLVAYWRHDTGQAAAASTRRGATSSRR